MNRIRSLIDGLRLRDYCLLGGYALYLAFGYMAFESSTVLSSGDDLEVEAVSLFVIVTLAVRLVVFLIVAMVSSRFPEMRSSGVIVASMVFGAAGFLVMGMLLQIANVASQEFVMSWLGVSGAFLGAAAALGSLVWARFVSTLGIRSAYLYVVLSNITSLPVYLFITLLPPVSHVPICCILLIASLALAKPCIDMRPASCPIFSQIELRTVSLQLWRPVLGTCVLAFMSGFMLQVALWHPIPLDVFQGTALVTQLVVMVILLIPALMVKRPIALASIYKIALPLSAMGFLLLPVIWINVGGLANACAQLGYLVAGIILWCMLSDSVRASNLPSALLFSLAFACIAASQLVGAILGFMGRAALVPGQIEVTAIALVSIYAVAMVSMFLFKDRSFKNGNNEARSEAPDGSHEAPDDQDAESQNGTRSVLDITKSCCEAISDRAHLTPREREILLYLGRGHTISSIAEELVVSENTVKFHVKGIYQKLGVHSRSEIMTLIDNEQVS